MSGKEFITASKFNILYLLIVMYKWDYQKTTREKLNTLLKDFHANYKRHLENKGVTHYVMKDGKFLPAPDDFSMPYNPIELE